jgi:hypothetical protein
MFMRGVFIRHKNQYEGQGYLRMRHDSNTITASAPNTPTGSATPDFVEVETAVAADMGGRGVNASSGRVVVAVRMSFCRAPTGGTTLMT